MNKLPTKQIYLLVIIIAGILGLSVYSTYAIFTFDSETSEAVSISLPNVLNIDTSLSEYKQLELKPNSNTITDIDIYNRFEYDICYSIWYKELDSDNSIEIYELNTELNTSGTVSSNNYKRVKLLITNNSTKTKYLNLGLATTENTGTCKLNLSSNRATIKNLYSKDVTLLSDKIISTIDTVKEDNTESYYEYSNITNDLIYESSLTLYKTISVKDNKFILSDEYIVNNDTYKELDLTNNNYYMLLNDDSIEAIKINKLEYESNKIVIKEYTTLEPIEKGLSGIKKIDNDYIYYGDNPDNYISYNCDLVGNCELWRIIGLYYDDSTKLYNLKIVKNDSIGKYKYNDLDNIWNKSSIYKYLNEEYIKEIDTKYITIKDYNYELLKDNNDIENIKVNSNNKEVLLLTLKDFINTSSDDNNYINNNWLTRPNIKDWTMTLYNEVIEKEITQVEETEELTEEETTEIDTITINKVLSIGSSLSKELPTELNDIRPVLYLSTRVLYGDGDGSLTNPYKIK